MFSFDGDSKCMEHQASNHKYNNQLLVEICLLGESERISEEHLDRN